MKKFIERLRLDEVGATAVEYGIMVALIAIVIILAVFAIGQALKSDFECVASSVQSNTYAANCPETS